MEIKMLSLHDMISHILDLPVSLLCDYLITLRRPKNEKTAAFFAAAAWRASCKPC